MDALGALLDGPRARRAFVLRALMSPPWSVRVDDQAPVSVVAVVRGDAWVAREGAPPVHAGTGDVVLLRGPEPYVFADDPATPPQVVILPGQRCTTPDGHDVRQAMDLGVRTWGNDPRGTTTLLIGTYEHAGDTGRRVLDALPPTAIVAGDEIGTPLLDVLAAEIVRDPPGQQSVLDRLLDLVLVAALRAWLARLGGDAPGWYRADADPVVGPAIRLLQQHPDEPWTVASLAARVGVSRAALARRFSNVVGEPPMTFLARWRLELAADLLRDPDRTIAAVAHQVGYGSAFALSTAFRRHFGCSPKQHRARAG